MSESVDIWIKDRTFVRAKITRLCNKIGDQISISSQERHVFTEKLTDLKLQVQTLDKNIFSGHIAQKLSDELLNKAMTDAEMYEDKMANAMAILNTDRSPQVQSIETLRQDANKLKLPQVPLPEFGNKKGENFHKFIKSFEAIVHKHTLSDHEMFVYLNKQLSGGPKVLVESLDVDQQSYAAAKDLLTKAFDSGLNSKYAIIRKLSELKLPKTAVPYPFIGEIRTVLSGLKSNNITLDDVCQYFIWNGLNDDFQFHMTAITNKSKPTLDEVTNNIFEATNRYLKQMEKSKDKQKSYSNRQADVDSHLMAVNLNSLKKKIFCALCSNTGKNSDHLMKDCTVFSTAKMKFDKLRQMGACTKCSFKNHETKNCKFSFKSNCRFCQGTHMSYLCLKSFNKNNTSTHTIGVVEDPDNFNNETSSFVLLSENYEMRSSDNIILPTFVANLKVNGSFIPVRIFKDGGSQRTFICDSLNSYINAPIVNKNIPLTIQGFNSSRKIHTKSVSICLEINGMEHDLTAICVDAIRTKFNVSGIHKVVEKFVQKGYKIADENFLNNNENIVNNIDMILGSDVDHLLPLNYKTYGPKNDLSSFISSPAGVIFSGDISKMFSNLSYLPPASANDGNVKFTVFPNSKTTIVPTKPESIELLGCTESLDFYRARASSNLISVEDNELSFSTMPGERSWMRACSKIPRGL